MWHLDALTMSARTSSVGQLSLFKVVPQNRLWTLSQRRLVQSFCYWWPRAYFVSLFGFWDRVFCIPGWLWTWNVVEDELHLPIFLFLSPLCWDCRYAPQHMVFTQCWDQTWASVHARQVLYQLNYIPGPGKFFTMLLNSFFNCVLLILLYYPVGYYFHQI